MQSSPGSSTIGYSQLRMRLQISDLGFQMSRALVAIGLVLALLASGAGAQDGSAEAARR